MNVDQINGLSEGWWFTLGHVLWQSTLLAIVVLLLLVVTKRRSSHVRYAILVIALCKFLVPPFLWVPMGVFGLVEAAPTKDSIQVQAQTIEQTNALPEPGDASSEHATASFGLAVDAAATAADPSKEPALSATSDSVQFYKVFDNFKNVSLMSWLMFVHIAGILCLVVWTVRRHHLFRRRLLRMTTNPQPWERIMLQCAHDIGLRRRPTLRICSDSKGPYSCGLLRPTVVLPKACLDMSSEDELRVVICHELAHHRLGDFLVIVLQQMVSIFWWFNPIVWVLGRVIRAVREDRCDDYVLAKNLSNDEGYCDVLMSVAKSCGGSWNQAAPSIPMAHLPLGRRFRRILDERVNRTDRLPWTSMIAVVLIAVVVLPGLNDTPNGDSDRFVELAPNAVAAEDVPADSNPKWPVETEVLVVDAENQPLAGAPIKVKTANEDTVIENYRTDESGRVTVALPKERPVYVTIRVEHPRYVSVARTWYPIRNKKRVPDSQTKFQLETGQTIGGLVVDTKGQPVEDALVHLQVSADKPGPLYFSSPRPVKTDGKGRWAVKNCAMNIKSVSIKIHHANYVSDVQFWDRDRINSDELGPLMKQEFKSVVVTGQHVLGKVTDEAGNPVVGARLAMAIDIVPDHADRPQTDESGRYQFNHCTPGQKHIVVFHPDYAPEIAKITVDVKQVEKNFVLKRGKPSRLKFVDENGDPIPGMFISTDTWRSNRALADPRNFDRRKMKSDVNGFWEWKNAPPEPIRYRFYKLGWRDQTVDAISPSNQVQTIVVKPAVRVTGNVVDLHGIPMQSFKVTAGSFDGSRARNAYQWFHWDTKKFTDGRFELEIDRETTDQYAIKIEADGYRVFQTKPFSAIKMNINARLTHIGHLAGTVLEPDGTVAADAKLIIGTVDRRPYIRAQGECSSRYLTAQTDQKGRFAINDPNTDFSVYVYSAKGFAIAQKSDFEKAGDEPITIATKAYTHVSGTLANKPKPGVQTGVSLYIEGEMGGQTYFGKNAFVDIDTLADENGNFEFKNLPPDMDVRITQDVNVSFGKVASVGTGGTAMVSLESGKRHQVVVGLPGREIVGKVVLDESITEPMEYKIGTIKMPPVFARDFKSGKRLPMEHFAIQSDGAFSIAALPPGTYDLSIGIRKIGTIHNEVQLGKLQHEFVVPKPTAANPESKALDLGELTIEPL